MTIKEIRERYSLTQAVLSKITGIPLRSIENWEAGKRKHPHYIPDLVEAKIRLTLEELQGGK